MKAKVFSIISLCAAILPIVMFFIAGIFYIYVGETLFVSFTIITAIVSLSFGIAALIMNRKKPVKTFEIIGIVVSCLDILLLIGIITAIANYFNNFP